MTGGFQWFDDGGVDRCVAECYGTAAGPAVATATVSVGRHGLARYSVVLDDPLVRWGGSSLHLLTVCSGSMLGERSEQRAMDRCVDEGLLPTSACLGSRAVRRMYDDSYRQIVRRFVTDSGMSLLTYSGTPGRLDCRCHVRDSSGAVSELRIWMDSPLDGLRVERVVR